MSTNDNTVINPNIEALPFSTKLAIQLEEHIELENKFQETVGTTLKIISDSLVEHRTIMQQLTARLESTTISTLEMEKKFHGHTKMFQGAMIIMSVLLSLFCWILLERNTDIKDLAKIANITQTESQIDRARREQDQRAMEKEILNLHARDTEMLQLLRQGLDINYKKK